MVKLLDKMQKLSKEVKKAYLAERVGRMAQNGCAIEAVYDEELDELLKSLEIYEPFKSGKLKCYFCEQIVTEDNLGSIFPYKNDIKVSCTSLKCAMLLLGKKNE